VLMPAFGAEMPAMAMGLVCFAGADQAAADAAIAPLLALDNRISTEITEKAYADVLEEAQPPPGVKAMATNALVEKVTDEVVAAVTKWYASGTAGQLAFIRALGGAMNRVPSDATAFAHRAVEAMIVGAAFRPVDAPDDELVEAVRPFDAIKALGVGAYAGFLGTATEDDVAAIYPAPTRQRLAKAKRKYDPRNLFSQNFNIQP
jgi:hypothetical protein